MEALLAALIAIVSIVVGIRVIKLAIKAVNALFNYIEDRF